MGVLNKMKFWKKDELDFDKIAQQEFDKSPFPPEPGLDHPSGMETKDPFMSESEPFSSSSQPILPSTKAQPWQEATSSYRAPPPPSHSGNLDLELINSKLDTIKAMLTSVEQRLANLERAAGVEQKQQRLW